MDESSTQKTMESEEQDNFDSGRFKDIQEKSQRLQQQYQERKSKEASTPNDMPPIGLASWITGMSTGEVIDMDVAENGDVILDVGDKSGYVRTVRVRDYDEKYTGENELVRLLTYKGIENGDITKLLGKEIPIYIDRYALPSNSRKQSKWRPYIPNQLNLIGRIKYRVGRAFRYMGYEGEFQGKLTAIGFLVVSLFWWFVFFGVISVGVFGLESIIMEYDVLVMFLTALSFSMTVYTPLIIRIGRISYEKAVEIKSRDPITG